MSNVLAKKVRFPVSVSELFPIFANAEDQSRATGFRTKGDATAGTEFSACNGAVRGKTLFVEQNRLIVQSWRASSWSRDAEDSILVLRFVSAASGTELYLTQSGILDGDILDTKKIWNTHFWKPIKRFLKAQKAALTPSKPRGRPRKTAVRENDTPKVSKPRGRPRKSALPAGQASAAIQEPKRRGRPAKAETVKSAKPRAKKTAAGNKTSMKAVVKKTAGSKPAAEKHGNKKAK